jgi:colanic acid biosynthesis glycosyl transferase WcaI
MRNDPRGRLLIVTPYYRPDVAASVEQMAELASGLAGKGWRVTVLCSRSPTRPQVTGSGGLCDIPMKTREHRVVRIRVPRLFGRGTAQRVLEWIWFYVGVYATLRKRRFRYHVAFVSSTPPLLHIPVLLSGAFATTGRHRIAYNVQDVFPEFIEDRVPLVRRVGIGPVLRRIDAFGIRRVAVVIVPGVSFVEPIARRDVETTIRVVRNWVDTDTLYPKRRGESEVARSLGLLHKVVVLYTGRLGVTHDFRTLLDAADVLRDRHDIVFLIAGQGPERAYVEGRSAAMTNVCVCEPVAADRLVDLFTAGSIGVVPMKAGAAQASIPSKTWGYLSCGLPVVVGAEACSDIAKVVAGDELGIVVEPADAHALASAIRAFADDVDLRARVGIKGRQYVVQNLGRHSAVDAIDGVLTQCVLWPATRDSLVRDKQPSQAR